MVKLLASWTTTAPRDVKLCVSSREYNIFINAFSAEKRLRLHELTSFNIEAYARDKLAEIPNKEAKGNLIRLIISKAKGIFLWVALVVKQIRD